MKCESQGQIKITTHKYGPKESQNQKKIIKNENNHEEENRGNIYWLCTITTNVYPPNSIAGNT